MSSPYSAEEQVVERARRGDRNAQHQLWRTHRRWVAAIILAHRPRSMELEDLLQDVAVKLVAKVHTLRDARAFRPWLRQIAVNACRGAGRSERTALRLSGDERLEADGGPAVGRTAEPAATDDATTRKLEQREAADRLLHQVMTLPLAYREPLLLRCMHSMSYQQISEVLDLPLTTVETRLARARRMLREELGEADPGVTSSPDGARADSS